MGDFNEAIGIKANEMASVISEGRLTDTHCFRHGIDNEQPTYARGSKRVDYVLVSSRLTAHIRATGAEPLNFRIFSDHRGIFVDFALPGFFDRAPNALAKTSTQIFFLRLPTSRQAISTYKLGILFPTQTTIPNGYLNKKFV